MVSLMRRPTRIGPTRSSSGPRKRRPISRNASGCPVVRKRCSGGGPPVPRCEPRLDEQAIDVLGSLVSARHQGDGLAEDVRHHAGEQRVVGAAEDQGVDASIAKRVEVAVRGGQQLGTAGDPGLDEVDERRARLSAEPDVRGGSERVVVRHRRLRRLGADNPDSTGSSRRDGPPGGGKDDLDDRDVIALACVAQHRRARRVAGDHEGLDPLGDEMVEAVERVLAHLGDGLRPVRLASGVAEVEQRLVRQAGRARHVRPSDLRNRSRRSRLARRSRPAAYDSGGPTRRSASQTTSRVAGCHGRKLR